MAYQAPPASQGPRAAPPPIDRSKKALSAGGGPSQTVTALPPARPPPQQPGSYAPAPFEQRTQSQDIYHRPAPTPQMNQPYSQSCPPQGPPVTRPAPGAPRARSPPISRDSKPPLSTGPLPQGALPPRPPKSGNAQPTHRPAPTPPPVQAYPQVQQYPPQPMEQAHPDYYTQQPFEADAQNVTHQRHFSQQARIGQPEPVCPAPPHMSRNATCQPSFAEPPLASNVPGGDAVGAGGPPPPISANANVLADVGEQLLRAEKVIVSKLDAKGAPQRAFGTYILVVTRMDDEVKEITNSETGQKETVTLKRAMLDVPGHFSVELNASAPAYRGSLGDYCFRDEQNNFWAVMLDVLQDIKYAWEYIMDDYCTFQFFPHEDKGDPKIETEKSRNFRKYGTVVEKGGDLTAKGIVSASAGISRGVRGANNMYLERQEKGSRDLSEEERLKMEKKHDSAKKLQGTTSKITGAIGKGCSVIGTGIAKGGHMAKSQYEKTDYAQEREMKKKLAGPEKDDSSAAMSAASSTVKAFSTVIDGVKMAGAGIATDVRDTSVQRAEHQEGEEVAAIRRKDWDANAHYLFAGVDGVKLFSYTNVGMLELGTKVGVKVGVAAARYDALRKNVLFGGMYKVGWATLRTDLLEGYINRWVVLRPMSLAFYNHPTDNFNKPAFYVQLHNLKKVHAVSFHVCKREFGIELLIRGKLQYFSLQLDGPMAEQMAKENVDLEAERLLWIKAINALKYFNRADS